MLKLINICKWYGNTPVLNDLSWQVPDGAAYVITGPSGSGKSTLLNIIGTLDKPTAGQIFLNDKDISNMQENQLAMVRNRDIGFVFQLHHLLPQCTVLENVLIPTLAMGSHFRSRVECAGSNIAVDDQSAQQRAHDLLERMGLAHRLNHRPGQLSGGERQRVAVARALINKPKLLLADEPTGSLDRKAAEKLTQLLIEINREQGVTLIVATHSMKLACQVGPVWQLSDGKLQRQDMTTEDTTI